MSRSRQTQDNAGSAESGRERRNTEQRGPAAPAKPDLAEE